MTEQSAERFARALVNQFGKEREFQFEIPEGHNVELVTLALERLGCAIESNPSSMKVTVRVPGIPA